MGESDNDMGESPPSDNDISSPNKTKNKKDKRSPSDNDMSSPNKMKNKKEKRSPSLDDMSSPNKTKNKKGKRYGPSSSNVSPKKKGKRSLSDGPGSSNRSPPPKRSNNPSSDEDLLDIFSSLNEIKDNLDYLTSLLHSTLKKRDIDSFNTWKSPIYSPWTTIIYSLKEDLFQLMPPQYQQPKGNCWAVAHFRQWFVMNGLIGGTRPVLTLDKLEEGTSRYQDKCGGISKVEAVGDFMMSGKFVKNIKFHYRPHYTTHFPMSSNLREKNEEFERFIISLLRRDRAVAVSFYAYPSYENQTTIWTPLANERCVEEFEISTFEHAALLTGCGTCLITGKDFWEIYESSGPGYGVNGLTRLAMHQGLLLSATEMEL